MGKMTREKYSDDGLWRDITCFGAAYEEQISTTEPLRFRHRKFMSDDPYKDGGAPDGSSKNFFRPAPPQEQKL